MKKFFLFYFLLVMIGAFSFFVSASPESSTYIGELDVCIWSSDESITLKGGDSIKIQAGSTENFTILVDDHFLYKGIETEPPPGVFGSYYTLEDIEVTKAIDVYEGSGCVNVESDMPDGVELTITSSLSRRTEIMVHAAYLLALGLIASGAVWLVSRK